MDPPLPNTYWVIPELILAGEHPCGASEEKRANASLGSAGRESITSSI